MRRQLIGRRRHFPRQGGQRPAAGGEQQHGAGTADGDAGWPTLPARSTYCRCHWPFTSRTRSEEHTSELQSLMRISYAVFCLKKKNEKTYIKLHYKYTTNT